MLRFCRGIWVYLINIFNLAAHLFTKIVERHVVITYFARDGGDTSMYINDYLGRNMGQLVKEAINVLRVEARQLVGLFLREQVKEPMSQSSLPLVLLGSENEGSPYLEIWKGVVLKDIPRNYVGRILFHESSLHGRCRNEFGSESVIHSSRRAEIGDTRSHRNACARQDSNGLTFI